MTRILYISYDGMTDALGRSQVIPYLEGLSRKGYSFHVISCEKPDVYQDQRSVVERIFQQSGIGWTPLKFSTELGGLSKVYDIHQMKKAAVILHRQHAFDAVHCRSYMASFAGLALKRRFGIPFLFDMRGFWADERVEGNIWRMTNPLLRAAYHYFKKQEKIFFREADAIISLTLKGKEVIRDISGPEPHEKTAVIPCCTDMELFSPQQASPGARVEIRKQLHIRDGDFVLAYLGSLGTWYMAEEMMAFFLRLQIKQPTALFLFITAEDPALIMKHAQQAGVDPSRIRIYKASRNQVPLVLSLAHASIFFIRPVFSKTASSPTKQGEIMSMGIPFITNKGIGDIDQMVAQTRAGILIDDFSQHAYDDAVDGLLNILPANKDHIRQCALEHFSLDKGVGKYHAVYQKLLRKGLEVLEEEEIKDPIQP
ncbi:MAG: glycosyltransferase [Bacteroidales bacterium]